MLRKKYSQISNIFRWGWHVYFWKQNNNYLSLKMILMYLTKKRVLLLYQTFQMQNLSQTYIMTISKICY